MTPAAWGAVLGATLASGLLLVASRTLTLRQPVSYQAGIRLKF